MSRVEQEGEIRPLQAISDQELLEEVHRRVLHATPNDGTVLRGVRELSRLIVPVPETESKAREWAKIVRAMGKGYLCGLPEGIWTFQLDGSLQSFASPQSTPTLHMPSAEFGDISAYLLPNEAFNIAHLLAQQEINDEGPKANYIVINDPMERHDFAVKAKEDEHIYGVHYLMWHTANSKPEPFEFVFFLPPPYGPQIMSFLLSNPLTIETIFQEVYPQVTGENGLKRTSVESLKTVRATRDFQSQFGDTYSARLTPTREVKFPHPVGEIAS